MYDPSKPGTVLAGLEQRARRRFGQHFLHRSDLVDRMVRAARVGAGDRVVEVGPGLGILTQALLRTGADVTAFEIDRDLAAHLRSVWPELTLVETDATRVDWASALDGPDVTFVSNLPYNVGTRILTDVIRTPSVFRRAVVMLQAEVVERLVARPGTKAYGTLTVEVAARAKGRAVVAVPPSAFRPPPKVRSLVARFDLFEAPRTGEADPAFFDTVVRAGFSQRRKTLRNALSSTFGRDRAVAALEASGIDPGERAERLEVAAFVALAEALQPADEGGTT